MSAERPAQPLRASSSPSGQRWVVAVLVAQHQQPWTIFDARTLHGDRLSHLAVRAAIFGLCAFFLVAPVLLFAQMLIWRVSLRNAFVYPSDRSGLVARQARLALARGILTVPLYVCIGVCFVCLRARLVGGVVLFLCCRPLQRATDMERGVIAALACVWLAPWHTSCVLAACVGAVWTYGLNVPVTAASSLAWVLAAAEAFALGAAMRAGSATP